MSMNCSIPAKSTISSNRASSCFFVRPRIAPLRYTFSRPDSSGWKPAPSSRSAEILPLDAIVPWSGRRILAMHLSSVLLPEPFSPMIPNVEPSGTSNDTSWSAQNSS